MRYSELRQKDVINVCDGQRLGRITDLVLDEQACVQALVIPGKIGLLGCLRQEEKGVPIPWNAIRRIGDDVILVEFHREIQE